jgi:hypothetical protein
MRSWKTINIRVYDTVEEILLKRKATRNHRYIKEGDIRKVLIHYAGETITIGKFRVLEVWHKGEDVYIRCKRIRNEYKTYNAGEMDE